MAATAQLSYTRNYQVLIRLSPASRFVLALPLAALLCSCGRPSESLRETSASVRRSFRPVPLTRAADDAGRFLAGLPAKEGSPFKDLESLEAWQVHRRECDRVWGRVQEQWFPPMGAFQKKELSGPPIENSVAFYPFSGPDAMMITVFFPHNETYVMVGLEPAGTLPAPLKIPKEKLDTYLAEVRDTVSSVVQRSFFITREMDREFRGQVTDGLFPPILLLLARSHQTALGYRYVRLDQEGRVIERAADYKAPGRIGNKGLEIDFRTDADGSLHKLYYFSVNLSDARLRENGPFLAFLSGLKGMTTFFKATSYMPHQPGFTVIRDRVLDQSGAILQDDSGIPYRFFDAARWQVQLYGDYERPYGSFAWLEQPDLRKAYDTLATKPLGFRIGYGFSRIPSNLLLAKRNGTQAGK